MDMQKRQKIIIIALILICISLTGLLLLSQNRSSTPIINVHDQSSAHDLEAVYTETATTSPASDAIQERHDSEAESAETEVPNAADPEYKINLNTATKEELDRLEGIGPVTADKIIAYREQKPFKVIEDIKKIEGIGQKKFEAIRDFITVK